MKKIFLSLLLLTLPLRGYCHKLTIIFTGNSYASLYPCGHCPASVGGGVTRRATLLKELKDTYQNVVLLDAGNFTAGGSLDETSISSQMDKKRSLLYYQAMQSMGYEVVGVGEQELNFGLDFFKQNMDKFKYISANLAIKGLKPYHLEEFSKFKVAFIGLSPQSIYKKYGIEVKGYEETLLSVINELKDKKVELMVLISALGDIENRRLAEKFPQIPLLISAGPTLDTAPTESVGGVLLARVSYRAKELRGLDLTIENNKIVNMNLVRKFLSLDVAEEQSVKKSIPSCFQDSDCAKKEGLLAQCQNPGDAKSVCAYYEAEKIDAVLISDSTCSRCATKATTKLLKELFLGIQFKVLNYEDSEARQLIERYHIESLPAFILPAAIKEHTQYKQIAQFVTEQDNKIILKKELAGIFLYLKRKEIPKQIDFFLNMDDGETLKHLETLNNFSRANKVNLALHFFISPQGSAEQNRENIKLALAVKKLYPAKFFDYLLIRLKNFHSIYWVDTLDKLGLDYKKVRNLAKSNTIEEALKENEKMLQELGITSGNVLLINNRRIFRVISIDAEELKQFF